MEVADSLLSDKEKQLFAILDSACFCFQIKASVVYFGYLCKFYMRIGLQLTNPSL